LPKSKSNASSATRRNPSELKLLERLWTLHARLFISAACGVAIVLALIALPWRTPTRLIVGWDLGVLLYLALSYRVAAHASIATIVPGETAEFDDAPRLPCQIADQLLVSHIEHHAVRQHRTPMLHQPMIGGDPGPRPIRRIIQTSP
jgi:hypothetical protein